MSTTKSASRGPDRALGIAEVAQAFRLLSDETRLRIVVELGRDGEVHVGELCRRLGLMQPAVSYHLAFMRVSGFVDACRDGRNNFYRLVPGRFAELRDFLPAVPAARATAPRKARRHAARPVEGPAAEASDGGAVVGQAG